MTRRHPRYCCQECGTAVGYIGRVIEAIFGPIHNCREFWPYRGPSQQERSRRIREASRRAMESWRQR